MIAFLVIALPILTAVGGFYSGVLFQHKNDLLQARAEVQEEYNQMGVSEAGAIAERDVLVQELMYLQTDLSRANVRIKQLEHIAAVPLQRMPTGSLMHGYNKKQEAEKIDPTATGVLPYHKDPTDLPPMQLL